MGFKHLTHIHSHVYKPNANMLLGKCWRRPKITDDWRITTSAPYFVSYNKFEGSGRRVNLLDPRLHACVQVEDHSEFSIHLSYSFQDYRETQEYRMIKRTTLSTRRHKIKARPVRICAHSSSCMDILH